MTHRLSLEVEALIEQSFQTADGSVSLESVIRCYRAGALDALAQIPSHHLPKDPATSSIVVQAVELSVYGMFFMCGERHIGVEFDADGAFHLGDWLAACRLFFAHVSFVLPDLPVDGTDPEKLLMRCNVMAVRLSQLGKELESSSVVVQESSEDSNLCLHISNLKEVNAALFSVVANWIPSGSFALFKQRIVATESRLREYRQLVEELVTDKKGQGM